jgi:hypothetical protein
MTTRRDIEKIVEREMVAALRLEGCTVIEGVVHRDDFCTDLRLDRVIREVTDGLMRNVLAKMKTEGSA